jgi:hypothetical protein
VERGNLVLRGNLARMVNTTIKKEMTTSLSRRKKTMWEKLTLRWKQVDQKAKKHLERRTRRLLIKPGHRGRGKL